LTYLLVHHFGSHSLPSRQTKVMFGFVDWLPFGW
jgi:hypothetical protein